MYSTGSIRETRLLSGWLAPSFVACLVLAVAAAPAAAQDGSLTLDKTGSLDLGPDGVATPGDLIAYQFVVSVLQAECQEITQIEVTDDLVSPISCPSGNPIPALGSGGMETCTGSYAITQSDIDAGVVMNEATASGLQCDILGEGGGFPATATDDHVENIPQVPSLGLAKSGTLDPGGDGVATPGDVISYLLDVTNTGNVTLTNVTLSDPLLGTLDCPGGHPIPSLAPGATESCSGTYAITQADVDAGEVNNTAEATALDPQSSAVGAMADARVTIPPTLALEFTKTGALDTGPDGEGNPGDLISYTFLIVNNSNFTLSNLTIQDPSLATIDCPGGMPIATLAPGGSATCSGEYAITQADIDAGVKDNTAVLDAFDPAGALVTESDDHSEPIPVAGIMLAKSGVLDLGADGVASPGDLITYMLVIANVGTAPLTGVTLEDTVLASFDCPGGHPIPLIDPADEVTCTGTYAITQDDIDAGFKDNTASVSANEEAAASAPAARVSTSASTRVPIPQQPSLEIVKTGTLDLGGDGLPDPGDLVQYLFEVTNTGNVSLSDVSVQDPLVSPVTCPGGNPIPSLAPAGTVTCSGSYPLTADDIATGSVLNTAEAEGMDPGAAPVSDDDAETVALPEPVPDAPVAALLALVAALVAAGVIVLRRRRATG
jgi:uncharacterized repeat protein (TIGR01451 family)